ncbi:MAG: peptidoglycan-binding protein [Actinomycetota bacterium]
MSIITTSGTDGSQPDDSPTQTPVPAETAATNAPAAPGDHLRPTPTVGDGNQPPGRRRWPVAAVAVGLVAAGAAGLYLATSDGSNTDDEAEPSTIRAVTAEQRDLIEYTDLNGTLGYAETRSVSTTTNGTVTAVVNDGDVVERGDLLYEINAVPVSVFYGDIPLYRSLEVGDEGDDVLLLEQNLASLGYHIVEPDDGEDEVDTGFTVDGSYDAATADAVERWQADVGLEETGRFELGTVVVTNGPAVASGLQMELGSVVQAGAPVLDLNITGTEHAFHSAHTGEIELVAASGPVTTGQVLYTVDDRPITAIVTDETFDRDLSDGVADGDDVLILEEMLVALGYDARGDLVPDDEFDEITAEAVEDWQDDLADTWEDGDVTVDGFIDLDDLIIVEPGTTIESVTTRDGDVVATGSELFTWQGSDGQRIVTTSIEVADQDKLAEGATVDVEFPDGSLVTGTVTEVATSSTLDPTDPTAEAELAVEIALPSLPESAAGLNELDVEIRLVDELVPGATVVPASALVVTSDGGYAVEVVDGTVTTYVAVEPGMFADGFVEVTGIEPGTAVVVPT